MEKEALKRGRRNKGALSPPSPKKKKDLHQQAYNLKKLRRGEFREWVNWGGTHSEFNWGFVSFWVNILGVYCVVKLSLT